MYNLFIPKDYKPLLDVWQTEQAIKFIKDTFQLELSSLLRLRRITAPIIVEEGKGLNDNLSGVEAPVSFGLKTLYGGRAEIVQSLAKWKRFALWRYQIHSGMGIYTDMNAIRPDEITDNIHSIYVDQWDWEKVIDSSERTVETLYDCVKSIYAALLGTQFLLSEKYSILDPFLPKEIHFIHSQELLDMYPTMTAKEREHAITERYGAVFIRGIGGQLSDGTIHDTRSPDYDDWYNELNGDILVWNPVLKSAFELSSMGIRVNPESLEMQLQIRGEEARKELFFHKLLLSGELPQTMGGGIGQSRLCMLLLQKCHIGEVQAAIWPQEMIEESRRGGVFIL